MVIHRFITLSTNWRNGINSLHPLFQTRPGWQFVKQEVPAEHLKLSGTFSFQTIHQGKEGPVWQGWRYLQRNLKLQLYVGSLPQQRIRYLPKVLKRLPRLFSEARGIGVMPHSIREAPASCLLKHRLLAHSTQQWSDQLLTELVGY